MCTHRRPSRLSAQPLIYRLLPILILVFAAAAIVLAVTGGVDLRDIGIRFSSRDPLRPAIVAFVLALIYTARHRVVVAGALKWIADQSVKVVPWLAVALSLYAPLAMKMSVTSEAARIGTGTSVRPGCG